MRVKTAPRLVCIMIPLDDTTTDSIAPSSLTVHHRETDTTNLPNFVDSDEHSNDSIKNLDVTKSDVRTIHSDILTKECTVVLHPLVPNTVHGVSNDSTSILPTVTNHDSDSGFSENNNVPLSALARSTAASDSIDSEDLPLSELKRQNRG